MTMQGVYSARRVLAVSCLAVVLLLLLVGPAGAIKISGKGARQVSQDKAVEQDKDGNDTRDSAKATTKSLLDHVESQKSSGRSADTLDMWIDLDGDGVNDRLKKTHSAEPLRIETTSPAPKTKKVDKVSPNNTVKKDKTATDDPPKKSRRR